MTEGLATTVAPTSAPAAPAPVAAVPQASVASFDNWLATDRSAPMQRVEQAHAPAEQQPAQTEALAETMTEADVQALDQHWSALRGAVQPDQVAAFAQAMQAGEIPPQLHGATVRFRDMGQEVVAPLHEVVRGHLRLREYSRRMGELRKAQEQVDATVANIQGLFASWDNPRAMLESMKRLGKAEQFFQASKQLARDFLFEKQMTPQQREEKRRREEIEARERAFSERIAALEARERGAQQAAKTDSIAQALDKWVPEAFARHQVPDFPASASWFQANLQNLWQFGELTPQLVDDAAALTAEQYREAVRQHTTGQQVAQQQPAGPRALPVQGVAGNAGAIPAQMQRQRLSNFDEHVRSMGRR